MVTRRALLISNPGETADPYYCGGVYVDIRNYQSYLQQPHGGSWAVSEIEHLDRPSADDVRSHIEDLAAYEYSFVAFSGHGYYCREEEATILRFRKGQELPHLDLLDGAQRRTLVVDSCREAYRERIPLEEARMMAKYAGHRVPSPQLCREAFLRAVASASRGVIVAHGCAIDETAGDDQTRGGRYTASFLASANRWADAASERSTGGTVRTLSVVETHDAAAVETKRRSGGTQNPTIEKPRTELSYFPFAVFAD